MGLEGKTDAELTGLRNGLVEAIKGKGGKAGNLSLIRELNWPEDQYWDVRDLLVDAGTLLLGRGKGGSVRLIEADNQLSDTASGEAGVNNQDGNEYPDEASLYEPMAKCLREHWSKSNRYRDCIVEITARQGRRDTGGRWSRPDITIVGLSVFTYLPGRYLDVSTFEVKPANAIDITCVYESLAHRRGATRAFVLLHVPNQDNIGELLDEICVEAKRYGVGVITAQDPNDFATWDDIVEAQRFEPSPERLNDFIASQVSEGAKQGILQWLK